jgi:hypothetical protein
VEVSDAGATVLHRATDVAGNVSTVGEVVVPQAEPGEISVRGVVRAGKPATVKGTGFRPRILVSIEFDGRVVNEATTDERGKLSTRFVVPAAAGPGSHTVAASVDGETVDEVRVSVRE